MRYLSESDAMQMSGFGQLGDIAQGSDGHLYEWVEGIDGLGNPVGIWKRLRRLARPLVQRALPFARQIAPFVPGGAAALTAVTPILERAGVAGYGIGELYEASDGTVFQMQGLSAEDELNGFLADEELGGPEDEELRGLDDDDELRGLSADEELSGLDAEDDLSGTGEGDDMQGFADDPEISGIAADDDLQGMEDDDPLQGLDQGYVHQDGVSGIDAFVPQRPSTTRWVKAPAEPPEMWKPVW